MKEYFTYSLRVTDQEGTDGIENAQVIVYDKYGTEMINEITDSNGEITNQELLFRRHDYSDASPSVRTMTEYSPFRIVITKDNYEMYENLQIYDGCYDTKHKIGLDPVNKIRMTVDGELFLATHPEQGSSSKLLKL